jgi:RND family efflux transporter MFP subunit
MQHLLQAEVLMSKIRILLMFMVIILAIPSLAGCAPNTNGEEENTALESTLEFEDNIVSALGEVVPEQSANLSFTVGGYDLDLLFEVGEEVNAGQVLARVNNRAQEAALANAQSAVTSALTNLDKLEDIEADDRDIDVAEKAVAAAQANQALAQENLEAAELRAPFSGVIVDIFLQEYEAAAPNQPVILLADLSKLLVNTTDMSEVDVARVQIGDPAKVVFDALPDVTVTGQVVRIALRPEQGAGVYYTVTIQLDEIPENLRWGMSAFVEIEVSR